jgi:GLPGLI family protein
MRKILGLLVMVSCLATAQTHRFIYDYKYIPNSKEKENVLTDQMVLDITDKGSTYRSLQKIEMDSLMQIKIQEITKNLDRGMSSINFSGNNKANKGMVSYKVTKEYPDYTVYLHERAGSDSYKILDEKKQVWKISPETQKIGSYNAQKATTQFGGRDWVAWFATDLPFPDGPYKFHGLPGLIVKLEDTTGSHIITLVGNKKINSINNEEGNVKKVGDVMVSLGTKEITIDEAKFKKAWKNYLADPAKNIRNNFGVTSSFGGQTTVTKQVFYKEGGREIDQKEMIKNVEKRVKETQENNNNRIEPTLFD